jgi:hypothetical protein
LDAGQERHWESVAHPAKDVSRRLPMSGSPWKSLDVTPGLWDSRLGDSRKRLNTFPKMFFYLFKSNPSCHFKNVHRVTYNALTAANISIFKILFRGIEK